MKHSRQSFPVPLSLSPVSVMIYTYSPRKESSITYVTLPKKSNCMSNNVAQPLESEQLWAIYAVCAHAALNFTSPTRDIKAPTHPSLNMPFSDAQ